MRAYVQFMDAYGEWQVTERMSAEMANKECAAMISAGMDAFVRACN